MSFPRESFDENHIYDFLAEYERIRDGPSCNQCGFRREQEAKLASAGIDLHSANQRQANKQATGFVKQAEWIEKAVNSELEKPSCWYCDRLGDAIIALSAPEDATVLTGDASSFPVLTKLLGKPLHLIPSLDRLRAERDE